MTTIAYRNHILAADTQVTLDGGIRMKCHKIVKLPTRGAVAVAGNVDHEWWFIDWLKGGAKAHTYPTGYAKKIEAIWVDGHGDAWVFFGNDPARMQIEDKFYAVGEGAPLALAGMHTGMTAIQAVKFAAELNVNTNNIIDYYNAKTDKITQGW